MNGILLVDKPREWTSNDLCQYLKKKFRFKKVGHAGTLDPNATGLMVLLLNQMTKLANGFINDSKTYEGTVQLGLQTSTQDLDGEVVAEKPFDHIKSEDVYELVKKFRGEIDQVPPMVSAKKIKGVRLYKLARKGKVVDREPRKVKIFDFAIKNVKLPFFDFSVKVSKGFYVRTLADDIGKALGTFGTLASLRRTESGNFRLEDSVSWDQVKGFRSEMDLKPFLKVPEKTRSLKTAS